MRAIAFIVSPVNPKVGVIFTSPVFSAMESPLFVLYFSLQTHSAEPINVERKMLEGCSGLVKCNVSMAGITDLDRGNRPSEKRSVDLAKPRVSNSAVGQSLCMVYM